VPILVYLSNLNMGGGGAVPVVEAFGGAQPRFDWHAARRRKEESEVMIVIATFLDHSEH